MATFTVEATEHNDAGMIFDSTFPYPPKQNGQILHASLRIASEFGGALEADIPVTGRR